MPCLNEEYNIEPVYREIVADRSHDKNLEILFVDDGGPMAPCNAILGAGGARCTRVSATFIHPQFYVIERRLRPGYRYARNDWILHLDADLQFPPGRSASDLAGRAARAGL